VSKKQFYDGESGEDLKIIPSIDLKMTTVTVKGGVFPLRKPPAHEIGECLIKFDPFNESETLEIIEKLSSHFQDISVDDKEIPHVADMSSTFLVDFSDRTFRKMFQIETMIAERGPHTFMKVEEAINHLEIYRGSHSARKYGV
jgi:hypothetical protein